MLSISQCMKLVGRQKFQEKLLDCYCRTNCSTKRDAPNHVLDQTPCSSQKVTTSGSHCRYFQYQTNRGSLVTSFLEVLVSPDSCCSHSPPKFHMCTLHLPTRTQYSWNSSFKIAQEIKFIFKNVGMKMNQSIQGICLSFYNIQNSAITETAIY